MCATAMLSISHAITRNFSRLNHPHRIVECADVVVTDARTSMGQEADKLERDGL
jgi:ornithine carbamoyltransferase